MISELAQRLAPQIDPRIYRGVRAGMLPVDLALSLGAKRSWPLYRLWHRYSVATARYFDRVAPSVDAPEDQTALSALRTQGFAPAGRYPESDVRAAREWVLERTRPIEESAEPGRDAVIKKGRTVFLLDRRTARTRMMLDVSDPERHTWPQLVKEWIDTPSFHATVQAYFQTRSVLAAQPYFMAEVLRRGPDIERWHIDCLRPQVKAFVYLTDVGPDNGPLRAQPRTQGIDERRHRVFYDICRSGLSRAYFSEQENARLDSTATPVLGPAGTAVLVDTQVIHASSYCNEGMRVVLVNGYRPATALRLNPRLFRDPYPLPNLWEEPTPSRR